MAEQIISMIVATVVFYKRLWGLERPNLAPTSPPCSEARHTAARSLLPPRGLRQRQLNSCPVTFL